MRGNDNINAYRVQSIDLLRLRCLVYPTTIRAISTISTTSAEKAGARGGSTDGTAECAHLDLGRALARLPCGLEGLEGALHLRPRLRVPRLELGLVSVDECTRVLHARRLLLRLGRWHHGAVGKRARDGGCAGVGRRELLSEVCVGIELGDELLLLLLMRWVAAVARLLGLLLLIAVCLLCRIAGVLRLRLHLTWVTGGEWVDLAGELITKVTRLSGRLIARRRGVRRLRLCLVR